MSMTTVIPWLAGAAAAGVSLALTPLVGRAATAAGVVDRPGVRKVHQSPVPRVGGVAIAVAAMAAAVVACRLASGHTGPVPDGWGRLLALLAGTVLVLTVGLLDDVFDVRSSWKLLGLLAAAALVCVGGGAMRYLIVDGHRVFDTGSASWLITAGWIVTVTVAVNFIDGLDGLAAGIVATAAAVLGVGAAAGGYWPGAVVALSLAGALAGFLAHNRHPASVFMGDCGSMFIGFALAGTCCVCNRYVGTTRAMVLPAVALSVPLLDTALTMLRRGVLQRRSLFAAERGHIHHKLMDAGLGHRHAVMALHGATVAGGAVGLAAIFVGSWPAAVAAVAFGVAVAALFRTAGSIRAREMVAAVRRNRALARETSRYQRAFDELHQRFADARTADDWWHHLCRAADALDLATLDLSLGRRGGDPPLLRHWRRPGVADPAGPGSITADVPVPQRRTGTVVRARVAVMPSAFLESAGQRVALFARLLGECGLDRLPELPRPPATDAATEPSPADPVPPRVTAAVPLGWTGAVARQPSTCP